MYEGVVVGLHETQVGMSDLQKCMDEANVGMTAMCAGMIDTRHGMNEAREGMQELREIIACQGENINHLLDAMTSLFSNVGNQSEDPSSGMSRNTDNVKTDDNLK